MKKVILSMLAVSAMVFTSCSDDNNDPGPTKQEVVAPATYDFSDVKGNSNVSFSGQVARLKMINELKSVLGKNTKTEAQLVEMFTNGTGFPDELGVNDSGKKLRETVAAATNSNTSSVEEDALRVKIDGWLKDHATTLYANWDKDASAGIAGKVVTGSRTAYVNAKGVEYNQAFAKTLIGSVIVDQVVNKYVSQKYLEDNKAGHEAGTPYKNDDTKNYTALQHGWDEAYGYVFGLETDTKSPSREGGSLLNKYLKKVEGGKKFKGIFDEVYNAFKLGRAAIDAKDYELVNKQAEIIRTEISKVVGVMAVYYLQKGKGTRDANKLHSLSEGYGFVKSLRFVHINGKQVEENQIKASIEALEADNGLWSVTDDKLQEIADRLARYFGFTAADALSL
ncbi:DUF4856 domain-containing protein [Tenacibaculum sp. 190524A02b]|uniref:DUF4856 domain-containing protein n=1 Tax=Tenacibaculum vairaonense TaxID=3137860 RepID=A0ABM9PR73_9FLAO